MTILAMVLACRYIAADRGMLMSEPGTPEAVSMDGRVAAARTRHQAASDLNIRLRERKKIDHIDGATKSRRRLRASQHGLGLPLRGIIAAALRC